jgi:hypothetical protein
VNVTTPFSRVLPACACLALAVAPAGCGDKTTATTPTTPSASPTPAPTTPPAGSVVVQGTAPLAAQNVFLVDVRTTQDGRIDVSVDYTFSDSQVLLWLTDRQCNFNLFQADGCDYLVKSLAGPKPRTMSASGVKAGTYTLFIANDGPHDEQLTYSVSLASSAGAGAGVVLGTPVLRPRH